MRKVVVIFLMWFVVTCFLAGFAMLILSLMIDLKFSVVFIGSGIITVIFLLLAVTGKAEIKINNTEICKKKNQQ